MRTDNWMSDNEALLKDKPLREIAIPGTHDAGTYKLYSPSILDFAPDVKEDERWIYFSGGLITGWAQTQTSTVKEQLLDGIRYLDLRVAVDKEGDIRICHSLYGPKFEDIFDQIREFVDQNPREIVILGFNHFWDVQYQRINQLPPGENKSEGLTDEHWQELISLIERKLGNRLVRNSFTPSNSLGDLWADTSTADHRNQVIAIFDRKKEDMPDLDTDKIWIQKEKVCWSAQTDKSKYKKAMEEFIDDGTDPVKESYQDKFWAVKSCLTPSTEMYTNGLDPTGTYPPDLKNLAYDTNPVALGWLKDQLLQEPINLIWADYYQHIDLVALALFRNGIVVSFKDSPALGDSTNWGHWQMGWEIALEWMEEQAMQFVNWGEEAVEWGKDAVNDVVEFFGFDEPYKEKAEKPSNGTSPGSLVSGVRQYRIYLKHIKVKNAGSEDVWPDDPDLELYGAINVIPSNAALNKGANKYLWHKSQDQEVDINEGDKKKYDTYKDVYTVDGNPEAAVVEVAVNLREEDSTSGDDKMKDTVSVDLGLSVNETAEYKKTVSSGSQKVEIKFEIKRQA